MGLLQNPNKFPGCIPSARKEEGLWECFYIQDPADKPCNAQKSLQDGKILDEVVHGGYMFSSVLPISLSTRTPSWEITMCFNQDDIALIPRALQTEKFF